MQENNTENNIPKEEIKNNGKQEKKSSNFFSETKNEFKKITWPTKKILGKQTITVIVISLIVGAIIYGYDLVIDFAIQKLITL